MRVQHRLSRTKWLPMQRRRRQSNYIGINSKRNGLRSSPALSVARAILKTEKAVPVSKPLPFAEMCIDSKRWKFQVEC